MFCLRLGDHQRKLAVETDSSVTVWPATVAKALLPTLGQKMEFPPVLGVHVFSVVFIYDVSLHSSA